MKTLLVLLTLASQVSAECLTTNLVEILPYIDKFGKALELDLPQPLTTNCVSSFRLSRAGDLVVAVVTIQGYSAFGFNARGYVSSFMDRKHSLTVLWKAEDVVPLIRPTTISKEEAAKIAEKYLRRIGYDPSSALPPVVIQWKWEPKGSDHAELLPVFMVKFPRKEQPDTDLYTVEIDGLRERVSYFSTM
jgi:hypothetical protein